jgi:hypothetical protein
MFDLNIDVICANSPAAKGRVERAHQVLQDRLVKEAIGKQVLVRETNDGEVVIEFKGVALPARKFVKDARVNQAAVADNKILGPLLAQIQRRQQERDTETLATKRMTLRDEDLMRKDMGEAGLPGRRQYATVEAMGAARQRRAAPDLRSSGAES